MTQNELPAFNSDFMILTEEIISEITIHRSEINLLTSYSEMVKASPTRRITDLRARLGVSMFGEYKHNNQEIQELIGNKISTKNRDFREFLECFLAHISLGYAVGEWSIKPSNLQWVLEGIIFLKPQNIVCFAGTTKNITGINYRVNENNHYIPYDRLVHVTISQCLAPHSPYGEPDCIEAVAAYITRRILTSKVCLDFYMGKKIISRDLYQRIQVNHSSIKKQHLLYLEYRIIQSLLTDEYARSHKIIAELQEELMQKVVRPLIQWNFGPKKDYGHFLMADCKMHLNEFSQVLEEAHIKLDQGVRMHEVQYNYYFEGDQVMGSKFENSFSNSNIGNVVNEAKDNVQVITSGFTQASSASTQELSQIIANLRQIIAQFPPVPQEALTTEIDGIEEEVKKPGGQCNKHRLGKGLAALIAGASTAAIGLGNGLEITNSLADQVIELGDKMGVELQLPPHL